jgi:predicted nucleic acid-binding protein
MTQRFVLDAWALIALLQREEPAATRVKELLEEAQAGNVALTMSLINLGEVVDRVGKTQGEETAWETLSEIRRLPLQIMSVQEETLWAAVTWKMHHTLSYADAFAVATAENLEAVLLTGDPELIGLTSWVQIEQLTRTRR